MSNNRVAVRYARPLLELADEKKVLDEVRDDIANFLELCNTNREFVIMLKSPIISHVKKGAILRKIFGAKVHEVTAVFFDIVARKNRENLLPDIAREFAKLYNEKMGYQEATVTTTVSLDDNMRKAFEQLVTDVTGKKALLKEKINADLVGGYILQLGDQQIDESISGHLRDLQLKFQKETV